MGGSIFQKQGVIARRVKREEFEQKSNEVVSKLETLFKKIHIIQSFKGKIDFGDIDIAISCPIKTNENWASQIKNIIPHTHFAANGDEISLLVDNVQIDFRYIKEKYWNTSIIFSDFDPLSNSLGRIVRCLGFRYGYQGLNYHIYSEDKSNQIEIVNVSNNSPQIFQFLGLDWERYKKGFETQGDIFDFIVSSKYYSIVAFKEEEWDHSTRKRNAKRPAFCSFVKWAHERHNYSKPDFLPKDRRSEYIKVVSDYFNIDLQNMIASARAEHERIREINAKFNGRTIMELVGVEGAELGKLIGDYKNYIKARLQFEDATLTLDYFNFLEKHSEEQLKNIFLTWYQDLYKKSV